MVYCEEREQHGAGRRACSGFELRIPFSNEFSAPFVENEKTYE